VTRAVGASEESRVARRYRGSSGDDYFEWQSEIGRLGAELNRWKVEDYITPHDTVLDFGCGGGYLLGSIPAARKLGVEVSARAREVAHRNGVEVYSCLGDVGSARVDVVISHAALDHVLDPFTELKEMARVLKPGGRLVIWTPIDDWRDRRSRANDPNYRLFTWTPPLMRNLLAEAGFQVLESTVVTRAWSFRFTRYRNRVPRPVFDLACLVTAMLLHRRELKSVAVRVGVSETDTGTLLQAG
jgi:SAM-dependent methyltransferase